MSRGPETINEARLRDTRAQEEIRRVQHQGQLQHTRTANTADARNATSGIVAQAANTDMNMVVYHDQIKNAKVLQLKEKREKLVKKEEKYRHLVNVAWIAFPVTAAVYVCTLSHCCLPDMMKERKRNAERKINMVDAELMAITNVHVNRNFALSETIGSSDQASHYTGTGDPYGASRSNSIYAAASDPVYAVTAAYSNSRNPGPTAPPPTYTEHTSGGGTTTTVYIQ